MVTGQAATVAQEYKVEAMYYMISEVRQVHQHDLNRDGVGL